MDRLKFRLWDKDIGHYFEKPYIFINTDGKLVSDDCVNVYEIDQKAYTVEKCTGLKDKNGKLIYENDLIKIDGDVAVIKWSDYYARFMLESQEDNFDFETTYAEECEIIGNIHENKELLDE